MRFTFVNHTRHDIYRLWRDVRLIRAAEDDPASRAGVFHVAPGSDPDIRRRVVDGFVKLRRTEEVDLLERGAILRAIADVVILREASAAIPEEAFSAAIRAAERPLGVVAISQTHQGRYGFVEDATALKAERRLLAAALAADDALYPGEALSVEEIARITRVNVAEVRRILCRWMDDEIAYVRDAALDDDDESFILENNAQSRSVHWANYESERQRMRLFQLVIEVPRPFPNGAVGLVRGIGLEHELNLSEVLEASKGVLVKGVHHEDWTQEQIADAMMRFKDAVRATFADARQHEVPTGGVIVNTYNAQQVAAQGPGAQAIGNVMTLHLNDGDAALIALELKQLREELQKSIASAEDAIEIGAIAEAEVAAKAKNLSGVVSAIKRFGVKAYGVIESLGLAWLKAKFLEKTGVQIPQLPSGDARGDKKKEE